MIHYIAGQVTGLEPDVYYKLFEDKEKELKEQGLEVFNPIKNIEGVVSYGYLEITDYSKIMGICFSNITHFYCNEGITIHLLPNWKQSKGARKEVRLARLLDIKIVYP
jgi:hypothetical protein